MKIPSLTFLFIFLLLGSACSTLTGSSASQTSNINKSNASLNQKEQGLPAEYIQVLDELVANGCNISRFEMIERNKSLDMKIACK